jgi:hypothetical protein
MMNLRGSLLAGLVVFSACAATGMRNSPDTRYQGMILDARKLGADQLARVQSADPNIAAYVAKNGAPDFLLMPTTNDVELIYYLRSVLAQFHRPSADAASVLGELTPLPNAVLNVLPQDLAAGTPDQTGSAQVGADCWNVSVGSSDCRTCCASVEACIGSCKPRK